MALSTSLTKVNFSLVKTQDQSNFAGIVSASGFKVGSGVTINSSGLNVSGVSTLGVTSTTNLTSQTLNVSGVSTLGVTSTTNLTSQQLRISGISTLGVTSTTNLTSQTLNVSGVVTSNQIDVGRTKITSGIISATSGIITYYGDGSQLSNIISGVGIQSSGISVGSGITTLNFAGAGNTFSVSGSTATITISSGTNGIGVQSEGSTVGTGVTTLNFLGVANTFSYNQSTKVMNIGIPRSLTVGVRTGSSVNFLIQSGTFNVLSRSGQSIIINTAT